MTPMRVHNQSMSEVCMSSRHVGLHRRKRAVLLAALPLLCAACLGEDPIAAAPAELRPILEEFRESALELANPPGGAKPITLRMLASHTGGLVRAPALRDAFVGPIAEWEARVIAAIP